MAILETISVLPRSIKKDELNAEKEAILSDFNKLNFNTAEDISASDIINYNDGKEANPFDKIAKHYGRTKNVFLFISLLRNPESYALIINKIKEKTDFVEQDKFLKRMALYLNRIKLGEKTAEGFLNDNSFSGAFFNGPNINENLNINFTRPKQFLETHDLFERKIELEGSGELQRIKIYENGRRAVTIENNCGVKNYNFTKNASCNLVFKNSKGATLFLDIIAGKVVCIEQESNKTRSFFEQNESEVISFLLEDIFIKSNVYINNQSIKEVILSYVKEKKRVNESLFNLEECSPIKTLEDLRNWKRIVHQHVTENLHKREKEDGPKTLVCHDMKGGYLEDRFLNGCSTEDGYFFLHWQSIDMFVYFSHNLVTIPPCTWISAAHRNGVQVLGTFITEWEDGQKICKEFLKDEKSAFDVALQLVNVAKLCNFDGWLINIENKLEARQIPVLKNFLSFLSSKMSLFCPDSQVIWYDSVIKNGDLKWQNALNDNNKLFFDSCDAIFLNYNWKENDLAESLKAATDRQSDVYVGVDVFGRGCLGGGGFCTDVAVAEARKFGLSIAIFAPGWIHECLDIKDFKENQFKFWNALQKFCPSKKMTEPLFTSFCPGYGKKMYRDGKVISDKPWFNLGLQSVQPIFSFTEGSMQLFTEDAYDGGGCVCFSGESCKGKELAFKIFETDLSIEGDFLISYTYKPTTPNTELFFLLKFKGGKDLKMSDKDSVIPKSEKDLFATQPNKESHPRNNQWIQRTYTENCAGDCLQSIAVILTSPSPLPTPVSALLGELKVKPMQAKYDFTYRMLSCAWDAAGGNVKVKCLLEWSYQEPYFCSDLYIEIYGEEKKYVATTSQLAFNFEHLFPCIDSFSIILCPKCAAGDILASEVLCINIM